MKQNVFSSILCVLLMIAVGTIVVMKYDTIRGWFGYQPEEPVAVTVEPTEFQQELTILDVIVQRHMEIETMKVDSIYYMIPDPALIAILEFTGIEASHEIVVDQYLQDISYYNGLTIGAKKSKHYIPDSLPKSNIPLKPAPVLPDTTRH